MERKTTPSKPPGSLIIFIMKARELSIMKDERSGHNGGSANWRMREVDIMDGARIGHYYNDYSSRH